MIELWLHKLLQNVTEGCWVTGLFWVCWHCSCLPLSFWQEISKNFLNEGVMWQRNFHFHHYLQTLRKSNLWVYPVPGEGSLSFMKFYDTLSIQRRQFERDLAADSYFWFARSVEVFLGIWILTRFWCLQVVTFLTRKPCLSTPAQDHFHSSSQQLGPCSSPVVPRLWNQWNSIFSVRMLHSPVFKGLATNCHWPISLHIL